MFKVFPPLLGEFKRRLDIFTIAITDMMERGSYSDMLDKSKFKDSAPGPQPPLGSEVKVSVSVE